MEIMQEQGSYKEADISRPRKRRLTEDEIEKIRNAYIETGGCVRKTARHTGFGRSTVSRYAKARRWYEKLSQMDAMLINQKAGCGDSHDNLVILPQTVPPEKEGNGGSEAGLQDDGGKQKTIVKLKKMRQLLFDEIMADEKSEAHDGSVLKIIPKTLSEAVKALIDIDKRISEREESQSDTMLEPYLRILERCTKMAKD